MKHAFTLIEVLLGFCVAAIVAILIGGGIWAALHPAHIPDHGVIVHKKFIAAHTYNQYITTGKHTQVVPRYVPDSYGVVIQEDGTIDDDGRYYVPVERIRYESLHAGDVWNRVEIEAEKSP